tara:strand:+ start:15886 stop:16212 length:327 start_codon:yes stop_codon:yes gene_type:complete
MSFSHIVEQAIQASIARGDPDRLTNKGQKLDLTDWQNTPEPLRMGYSVLKSAGIKPAEVESKNQIADLKAAIKALDKDRDREARTVLVNKLNALMVTDQLRLERLLRR